MSDVKTKIKTTRKRVTKSSMGKTYDYSDEESKEKNRYAQFLTNSEGDIEHVVMHVDDWERLAKLDPVYHAKNKKQGLQINVMLPTGKVVLLPHAVAFMVIKHGEPLMKAWRLYRNYSQSDFEDEGIRQPTMHQIEKSHKNRVRTLDKMAELYGCDIDQLASFFLDEHPA